MTQTEKVKPRLPTLKEVERKLGETADQWGGRCYEIACACVKHGLVEGTPVYGHFTGEIHPKSYFGDRQHLPFVQHGWVLLKDGRVFDPTRWSFEARKPYLYVGPKSEEYDEGGNQFRKALRPPAPEYDDSERRLKFSQHDLPTEPWERVEKLLDVDYAFTDQEPGTLCLSQAVWIANAPFEDLMPHNAAIYKALEKVGLRGAIPIDNWKKSTR